MPPCQAEFGQVLKRSPKFQLLEGRKRGRRIVCPQSPTRVRFRSESSPHKEEVSCQLNLRCWNDDV